MSSKKKQQQNSKNLSAINQAGAIDLNFSLNALSGAGVEIQETLGQISKNLIAKHSELQAVDHTISIKKGEMEALHGVDSILLSIDEARAAHEEAVAALNLERENIKKSNNDLEQQLASDRAREGAEFKYNTDQTRKIDNDIWQEQRRVRTASERDRLEVFEKDLKTRLEVLKTTEKEYVEALTKNATFDEEVKKAVEREKAAVTNALQKDFTHQSQLIEVKHSSEILRAHSEISSKNAMLTAQQNQISELQAQLKASTEAQISLAKATVDGATNKQAQADALALMTSVGGGNGKSTARG